jgi:hypothetical protein
MKEDASRQMAEPVGAVPSPVFPPAAPFAPLPAYPGVPMAVAPVRTIIHPTRYMEMHTVTRYPVVHVFPSHTRHVHHNVIEHYCEYPHSESEDCCTHVRDHCCPPSSF